jgi:flagellar hook-basal body complex protein FliE
MSTPFFSATSAYAQAQRLISQAGGGLPSSPESSSATLPNFSDLVSQNLQSVLDAGKTSDKLSLDMVSGKANVVDVVTAISQTEVALETMVTVRDRVIQAYEEIMRMPI